MRWPAKNPVGRPADIRYPVSGIRCPVLGIRYQVLVLGIGYWNQVLESLLESHEKHNRQLFWLLRPRGTLIVQFKMPLYISKRLIPIPDI